MLKNKPYSLLLLVFLVLMVAVIVFKIPSRQVTNNFYFLQLTGESPSWKLEGYQIKMTPQTFKSGDGKLIYKPDPNGFSTSSFIFNVHAVMNHKDMVIQHKSVSGSEPSSFKKGIITGSIKGPAFAQAKKPITIKDISKIYAFIKWKDNHSRTKKEKIILYR